MQQLIKEMLGDPDLRKPITDGVKKACIMMLSDEYKGTTTGDLALRIGLDMMRAKERIH